MLQLQPVVKFRCSCLGVTLGTAVAFKAGHVAVRWSLGSFSSGMNTPWVSCRRAPMHACGLVQYHMPCSQAFGPGAFLRIRIGTLDIPYHQSFPRGASLACLRPLNTARACLHVCTATGNCPCRAASGRAHVLLHNYKYC